MSNLTNKIKLYAKTSLVNIVPNYWLLAWRRKGILRSQREMSTFWQTTLRYYFNNELHIPSVKVLKPEFVGKKIIWQYWGQGVTPETKLPEVVELCFNSVDKYKGEYSIIRLSDNTIGEYIALPDFVYEKLKKGVFTRTFFSDLLRVVLLQHYGGLWLDATVLLTNQPPKEYSEMDFFLFQRSEFIFDRKMTYQEKCYWGNFAFGYFDWNTSFKNTMLSSIMFAKPHHPLVTAMSNLLLYYWQTQDRLIDYFCLQILFHELVQGDMSEYNCPIVSDCLPHYLHAKVCGGGHNDWAPQLHINQMIKKMRQVAANGTSYHEIAQMCSFHKLTYFQPCTIDTLKKELKEYL